MYNSLKLTTQVAKTVEVFSSEIEQRTKNISNVLLQFCNLVYTPEVKGMIHMLEVLQNFGEIQDLNYHQFITFCEKFAQEYDGKVFEQSSPENAVPEKNDFFPAEYFESLWCGEQPE